MKINRSIFKEYDIRGKYPQEINAKSATLISKALVKYLKTEGSLMVVGRDKRPSSKNLSQAFVAGLADSGTNVIDIGAVTTPMLYFAVPFLRAKGGVMITASHLALNSNGMKFVRTDSEPIGGKELQKIYETAKRIR